MKVIIVGLGRMGTGLSTHLAKKGHDVIVIDSNPKALANLSESFNGTKIVGFGFDKTILEKAGIHLVDAVVSCTNSDEVNAVISRIAKNVYRVPRVIARLYDSQKADIYRKLGIQTIATTSWGIERATELITYDRLDNVYEIGNGHVMLVRIEIPPLLVGKKVGSLNAIGEFEVSAISRENKSFIPTRGTLFEADDVIYLTVISSATDKLKNILDIR